MRERKDRWPWRIKPLIVPEYGEPEQQSAEAQGMSKADLHLHTNLGDGTASPQRLLEVAKQRGLKVIAVTDHDHMEGCKRVQELIDQQRSDIEMIWGCEVTTRQGHFLGLFMKRPVQVSHARRGRHRGDQGAGRPLPHSASHGATGAQPEPPQDRGTADTRLPRSTASNSTIPRPRMRRRANR